MLRTERCKHCFRVQVVVVSSLSVCTCVCSVDGQRVEAAGESVTTADLPSPVSTVTSSQSYLRRVVPFSLTRECRLLILRNLKCIESPQCRLRCVHFSHARTRIWLTPHAVILSSRTLDNIEITVGEIVDALFKREDPVEQREDFRAQLAVVRFLDGNDAISCLSMDLSGKQLVKLNRHVMQHLIRLQSLDVSNNQLDSAALARAGVESLPLVQLNVSQNKVQVYSTTC